MLREELVEASVRRQLVTLLPNYGLTMKTDGFVGPAPNVVFRESFPAPDEREKELTATTIAFGMSADDGGMPAELGTTLTRYVHTIQAWVFALEPRFGRHVASAIKHAARIGQGQWGLPDVIPLLDFNSDPTGDTQIDIMPVLAVQEAHVGNSSIRPWDKYLWSVNISVQDIAYIT